MPKAKPADFTREFRMENGRAFIEERKDPVEVLGTEIPALDFDTVVQHLSRNGYDVDVWPNGGSLDVEGETDTKKMDLSSFKDDSVQLEFSIDIEKLEERIDEEIDDPKQYFESFYDQIVGEMVEREKKLERAAENYVSKVFENDDPIKRIESDFRKYGEDVSEIVDSYFGDMRPSELALNYAVHFELHPGESVENERRNLEGKMPLHYALRRSKERDKVGLHLERYLDKVLTKAEEREEISDELRDYWQDLE